MAKRAKPLSNQDILNSWATVDGAGNYAARITGSIMVGAANAPQEYGIDAAGADTYTTIVTASADREHVSISLQGSNDAIVSLDGGTTDHIYVPANSMLVMDSVLIANADDVQGKNATPGSNYTNLAVTIW